MYQPDCVEIMIGVDIFTESRTVLGSLSLSRSLAHSLSPSLSLPGSLAQSLSLDFSLSLLLTHLSCSHTFSQTSVLAHIVLFSSPSYEMARSVYSGNPNCLAWALSRSKVDDFVPLTQHVNLRINIGFGAVEAAHLVVEFALP